MGRTATGEADPKSFAHEMGMAALEGGTAGLFMAYFFQASPLQYVASALAAGAGAVALRLSTYTRPSAVPEARWLDEDFLPGTRPAGAPSAEAVTGVEAGVESLLCKVQARRGLGDEEFRAGLRGKAPVAEFQGGRWLVFDAPGAEPRVLTDRQYTRFRKTTRDLVQVEPCAEGTKVTRLYLGRTDSSLTGLPAVEVYDAARRLVSEDWYVEGPPSTGDEALDAHAALVADLGHPAP